MSKSSPRGKAGAGHPAFGSDFNSFAQSMKMGAQRLRKGISPSSSSSSYYSSADSRAASTHPDALGQGDNVITHFPQGRNQSPPEPDSPPLSPRLERLFPCAPGPDETSSSGDSDSTNSSLRSPKSISHTDAPFASPPATRRRRTAVHIRRCFSGAADLLHTGSTSSRESRVSRHNFDIPHDIGRRPADWRGIDERNRTSQANRRKAKRS